MKKRIDVLLAESGICRSRSEAKDLVVRGVVEVDNMKIDKVSREFEEESFRRLLKSGGIKILVERFVGRGAYKILHALKNFNVDVRNKVCLDIGSSTGGFTQVLLQNGAKKVYAVDVGSEQFDKKLFEENKARIHLLENTDIRNLDFLENEKGEKVLVDLVVCDVSFISVKEIVKILHKFLKVGAEVILLVKPQFEVGKEFLGKGGIVKDRDLQMKVLKDIKSFAIENGFKIKGETESPIVGGDGNVEYLLYLC